MEITEKIYYEDKYKTELDSSVLAIKMLGGGRAIVELARTIFYPDGGGQPSDQGEITSETGSMKIDSVRWKDGHIFHEGKLTGNITEGQNTKMSIKWGRRFKNMRVHSAGHLIHDVLMSLKKNLKPLKGNHGEKAFLEYEGELDQAFKEELEKAVNDAVQKNIEIRTWDSSYEEVERLCGTVPNLPKDKQIRMLQIGDYNPMPDGGVQVKSTVEIGRIVIHHITTENGKSTIRYGVAGGVG